MRSMLVSLALAALLGGCGQVIKEDSGGGGAEAGFALEPTDDGFRLRFKRSALGTRFLLAPALAKGPPLALSQAYPAKIVFFEQKGDALFLFEDLRALASSASLPVHKLLASFELLEAEVADPDTLLIDFNTGILDYLLALLDETGAVGDGAVRVLSSYVNKVKAEEGLLFADQLVEIEVAGQGVSTLAQVKYTLRPYVEPAGFPKRVLEAAFARVGFFESEPVVVDAEGRTKSYVNKWDTREPIVFHVPQAIPSGYDAAVRDGILYWNRAFGAEVVRVEPLPDGVTPHEPGYNVVQWLETEAMDFAYADWTSDPPTGKTLQAQVFIPSSFVTQALDAASQLGQQGAVKVPPVASRRGSATCFSGQKRFPPGEGLSYLVAGGLTPEQGQLFAQDVVRALTAHEIGHALGLRHNFNAKLGNDIPPAELLKAIQDYIATGNPPEGKTITNSVMEYLPISFNAMAGARIRQGAPAFKYDAAAIKWGYGDADFRALDFGGFCSDEQEGARPDCVQYATPGEPIAANFSVFLSAEERAVAQLAEHFTDAKAPLDKKGGRPADEVPLDPAADAQAVLGKFAYVIQMLRDFKDLKASFGTILDKQKAASPLTRKDEEAAILEYQKAAVKSVGGLAAMLDPLVPAKRADGTWAPALLAKVEARFLKLLDDPAFIKGRNAVGVDYELSAADLAHMKKVAAPYFKMFVESFLLQAVALLADVSKARWSGVDPDALSAAFKKLAAAIILAESTETVTGTVLGVEVTAAKPYFSQELMLAATRLLAPNLYDAFPDDFNKDAGEEVLTELSRRLDVLTRNGAAGRSDLPRELRKLALDIAAVGNAVP